MDEIISFINAQGAIAIVFIVAGIYFVVKKASRIAIALFWFIAGCFVTMAVVKGIIPQEIFQFGGV